jgi:hypothetical protein
MKFEFLKVEDVADMWVPDVRLFEQLTCAIWWLQDFIFEPAPEIRT